MHFLLTRPEEDNHKLGQILQGLGHEVSFAPLLKIDYYDEQKIDLDNFYAVLFTSANGVRAMIRNTKNREITCYAVGDATATEAKESGFKTVFTASGDVNKLAELVIRKLSPDDGCLLHISGKDTAGNLSGLLEKADFQIIRKQLYKATKANVLTQEVKALIASGEINYIPFYSPRTAKTFVKLIHAANLQDNLTETTALCLSPAVNDVISSLKWREILTSSLPDQPSLFKLINVKLEENRQ